MTIALGFAVACECALVAQAMWLARSIDAVASDGCSARAITWLALASATAAALAVARDGDAWGAPADRSRVPLAVGRLLGPIVAAFVLSPAAGCAAAAAVGLGALGARHASLRLACTAAEDAAAWRSGQEALTRAFAYGDTRDSLRVVLGDALATAAREQGRATRRRVSAALRVDLCREGMAGAVLAVVALAGRDLSVGRAVALALVTLALLAGVRELTAAFVALRAGVSTFGAGAGSAVTDGGDDERRIV